MGKVCAEVEGAEFSREVIAAVTEAAFNQSQLLAWDTEAFAKLVDSSTHPFSLSYFHPPSLSLSPRHAKRTVIGLEDVRLCCRRNDDLLTYVTTQVEKLKADRVTKRGEGKEESVEGSKGRKKRRIAEIEDSPAIEID